MSSSTALFFTYLASGTQSKLSSHQNVCHLKEYLLFLKLTSQQHFIGETLVLTQCLVEFADELQKQLEQLEETSTSTTDYTSD